MHKIVIALIAASCWLSPILAERQTLGAILPLSGEAAVFGTKLRQGMELAVELSGEPVDVLVEDGEFSNTKALSALHKLMGNPRVKTIIGPFGTGAAVVLAPVAAQHQVALLSVAMCDQRFAKLSNAVCIYPDAAAQFAPVRTLFRSMPDPAIRNIFLIREELDGIEQADSQLKAFADEIRATLLPVRSFTAGGSADFKSILTRAKNADLFVFGGMPTSAAIVLKQLAELGIRPRYRWIWSEQDQSMIDNNPELFEGTYWVGGLTDFSPWFSERFTAKFGKKPDLYHAIAFDATYTAIKAQQLGTNHSAAEFIKRLIALEPDRSACQGFHFLPDHGVAMRLDVDKISNRQQINILRK